jgi:hypothetical protein
MTALVSTLFHKAHDATTAIGFNGCRDLPEGYTLDEPRASKNENDIEERISRPG